MTAASMEVRGGSPVQHRSVVLAMLCFAIATALCAETFVTGAVPVQSVIWGSPALACHQRGLLFLTGPGDGSGLGLSKWKFGPWMLLWYAVPFGLAAVSWSRPGASTPARIAVPGVQRGPWLVVASATCWEIGCIAGPG